MSESQPDFGQLITLSEAMLEKAKAGLWAEVIAFEAKRDGLIRLFFSAPVRQDDAEAVASGIQTILAIDKEIIDMGVLERFGLLQILQEMEQGKKAIKAYTS